MNLTTLKRVLVIILTGLAIVISGCEKSATPSLYVDDEPADRPDPVVTGVEPADTWLAGVGTVTISGSNFSTDPAENQVFFGKDQATVISATANQLVVSTPNVVADSLDLKVAVNGAYLFSNAIPYSLKLAIEPIGQYGNLSEDLNGMAVDVNDNMYISVVIAPTGRIHQFSPDGQKDAEFATNPFLFGINMRVGEGNFLYFVRRNRNLYRFNLDTKTPEIYRNQLPNNEFDFDFDAAGNIYIGGSGDALALVNASDKSIETVADYTGTNLRSVRLYNGYVYVAGEQGGSQKVWRNKINAVNNLDPAEEMFDLTTELGENIVINNMEIAADGDIYLATDMQDPILIVHPDGSHEPLYPGLWLPTGAIDVVGANDMVWGNGNIMYVTRIHTIIDNNGDPKSVQNVVKVNILKPGATYNGRK